MDILPEQEVFSWWILNYGSLALFFLLALGIIALPIPEETLMIFAGILIRNGQLNPFSGFVAALGGSICGITVSYLLGRTAGHYILHHYGSYIGLTELRLAQVHNWFERLGKWALFIGYFIPGVRHFTGFFAGMTDLSYKQFTLFAYSGALVWVSTFVAIGYFFGHYCFNLLSQLEMGLGEITIGALLVIGLGYLAYRYKDYFKTHG